ncbi:hypothetical protein D3C84_1180120 [compost metagenome]
MALAQQRREQVGLTQPDRAGAGLAQQFLGIAGQQLQLRRGGMQQLGVVGLGLFGEQDAHQTGSLRRSSSSGRCSM